MFVSMIHIYSTTLEMPCCVSGCVLSFSIDYIQFLKRISINSVCFFYNRVKFKNQHVIFFMLSTTLSWLCTIFCIFVKPISVCPKIFVMKRTKAYTAVCSQTSECQHLECEVDRNSCEYCLWSL